MSTESTGSESTGAAGPTGARPALESVRAAVVVVPLALASAAVMAVMAAAVTRDEAHEETAEEDGPDDEDGARYDADPCRHFVESAVPTFHDGRHWRRCDGRSVWCDGVDGPGFGFGLRCFAHVIHSARPAEALVMNWL
jgi:hypothetical protein